MVSLVNFIYDARTHIYQISEWFACLETKDRAICLQKQKAIATHTRNNEEMNRLHYFRSTQIYRFTCFQNKEVGLNQITYIRNKEAKRVIFVSNKEVKR